ncbi:hypothetical protein FFK22_014440 [Mycobacterium sp. KBS0706]|uniref:CHC2 zinc finger domain-containing protein n=1 Tax=Mycobacterium sp. KBS0706 TaxID=2578109 RepID=UPI00110FF7AD|nr:CHC2 zinc finger domain-containing protein [Mycobacterium sp. KBS0706]TSD88032.1 hypothetical protein FFK22_014440 [Mycobacterium sp. KBS0706]
MTNSKGPRPGGSGAEAGTEDQGNIHGDGKDDIAAALAPSNRLRVHGEHLRRMKDRENERRRVERLADRDWAEVRRARKPIRQVAEECSLPDVIAAAGVALKRDGNEWLAGCPFHEDDNPSFRVYPAGSGGKAHYHCFGCQAHGDAVDFVRTFYGIDVRRAVAMLDGRQHTPAPRVEGERRTSDDDKVARRMAVAFRLWSEAVPILGTPASVYLTFQRGIPVEALEGLDHAVRWHPVERMILALMRDPKSGQKLGVHRTFISEAGAIEVRPFKGGGEGKRGMLGPAGVVRLSHGSTVTMGLGICEGLEDGLAILASGWAPVWSCLSAGMIERFPLLDGIEHLTVFADPDPIGEPAAQACLRRWHDAGRGTTFAVWDGGADGPR